MAGKITTQLVIEGQDKSGAAFDQVGGRLDKLTDQAKRAAGVIAGALSVGAFTGWIKGATEASAEMGQLAKLSGTSADVFSAWSYAAKSVGVEQDKLGDIFKDVQEKVGEFLQTGGGEMKDFFTQIAPLAGVTAEQFRGLSGPDALQLFVSTLEKANLSQSEMTFYMESIANDATVLLPLLTNNAAGLNKLTAEARQFGVVVGDDTAAKAKEFNRQLDVLGAVASGVGQRVSAELLPDLIEITSVLRDPSTAEAAASFASGITGAFRAIIEGAHDTVGFVKWAAESAAASLNGAGSEDLVRLQNQLTTYQEMLSNPVKRLRFGGKGQVVAWFNEADIRANIAATQAMIDDFWAKQINSQGPKKAAEAQAQAQAAAQASTVNYVKVMGDEYKKLAEVAKQKLSDLTSAENKAKSDLQKVREERLQIQKRYTEALAGLQGGGEASYGAAEDLKVKARQALDNKDIVNAQAYAQSALKMLQDLAAAGGNTYGFEGFIKELQGIELAANGIEQSNAEAKIAAIVAEIDRIKASADPLKDIKIDASLSPDAAAKARSQLEQLAADLGQTLTIPITPVTGDYVLQDPGPAPQGFATGGYISGPGTGTSDSILARLSNGEFVMRAAAVKHYGPALLAAMNGLQLPKFADGGLVNNLAPATPSSLGTLNFNLPGGESFSVPVTGDNWAELHKAALKYGRTTRR